jgi:hypothetical protein
MRPNFGSPGTIGMQRSRAVLFDPFPKNDLGPPVVGGRPREFDTPLSEATDLQGSPFARQSLAKTLFPWRGRNTVPANPSGF